MPAILTGSETEPHPFYPFSRNPSHSRKSWSRTRGYPATAGADEAGEIG